MSAVAYLKPLSSEMQQQFDSLNLSETTQEVIRCTTGCGAEYVLIYPQSIGADTLEKCRNNVLGYMGKCGSHQPRIWFNNL
jgi:hypothetical protein